jgi:transposase
MASANAPRIQTKVRVMFFYTDCGCVVHAINPKKLDRLRDRCRVAGVKDDRRDARIAAAGLRTDPQLFRPVRIGDPMVIELREWSRLAAELQQERVRLGNRIRQQLWRYYPQLLELTDDVAAEWILELWLMAPTPAKAAHLRRTTLARLLKQHRIRKISAETALDILRAPALTVAAGVTEAAVLHLRSLVTRLRLANREFRQADRKLDDLCAALVQTEAPSETARSDAAILASLPGVGKTILATLLTEAPGPLTGRDHKALRTLSGVAPVTKRSGKSCVVVMRHAAHARLRKAVFHWARVAVQNDPKSKSRYEALRARGLVRAVLLRYVKTGCWAWFPYCWNGESYWTPGMACLPPSHRYIHALVRLGRSVRVVTARSCRVRLSLTLRWAVSLFG